MFFGKPLMCDFSKMSEKIRKADVVVEMDMKGIDIKTGQKLTVFLGKSKTTKQGGFDVLDDYYLLRPLTVASKSGPCVGCPRDLKSGTRK